MGFSKFFDVRGFGLSLFAHLSLKGNFSDEILSKIF